MGRNGSAGRASGIHPQQSFQHTLQEISVNRHDPCELVRELVSNSIDAAAKSVLVFPLHQHRGLIFVDDGVGLAQDSDSMVNGVTPYVAFFSIGKGTKTRGQTIGYKCQGTKLCFASSRFSLITRCKDESDFRHFSIDNPKIHLSESTNIAPQRTRDPAKVLRDAILPNPDERTTRILKQLDKTFFAEKFPHGLMLILENFDVSDFESYFSTESSDQSYLVNYIRFFTAHGDTRTISQKQGFRDRDVKAVASHRKRQSMTLKVWMTTGKDARDGGRLEEIPPGWPYLDAPKPTDQKADSPLEVSQLRKGRFTARFATTFKYSDRVYSAILVIDGKRRTLDSYSMLGRQSDSRSGFRLSDHRGVLLSSQGVRICGYPQLLEASALDSWKFLAEGQEHFVLFIDGTFELVTNRNMPAQSSLETLRDEDFLKHIAAFIDRAAKEGDDGKILRELRDRLSKEVTSQQEDNYLARNRELKKDVAVRRRFRVTDVAHLKNQWFVEPQPGEEHFVGALYTLFAHIALDGNRNPELWPRPITFGARGIDAIALRDKDKAFGDANLMSVEYKFRFSTDDEFNHPLSITDHVVCWDWGDAHPRVGTSVRDSYHYRGFVKSLLPTKRDDPTGPVGVIVGDLEHEIDGRIVDHEVKIISVRAALEASFKMEWRSPK